MARMFSLCAVSWIIFLLVSTTLSQTSPKTHPEPPPTAAQANATSGGTARPGACPLLQIRQTGTNLFVDLLPNHQCQMVVTLTPRKVNMPKLLSLFPRRVVNEIRDVFFMVASLRRAVTPQTAASPPVNCPPFHVGMKGNTLILETMPRNCFITITYRESETPEWNTRFGIVFTTKKTYEVRNVGPFLAPSVSQSSFPTIPQAPPQTGASQPSSPVGGLPPTGSQVTPQSTVLNVPQTVPQNAPQPGIQSFMPTFPRTPGFPAFPQINRQFAGFPGGQQRPGAALTNAQMARWRATMSTGFPPPGN